MSATPDAMIRGKEARDRACVIRAMNEAMPSARNGRRSKCWRELDEKARFTAAWMFCVEKRPLTDILAELKAMRQPMDQSSLARWLSNVDREFRTQVNNFALFDEATAEIDAMPGDIVAQLGVVWQAGNTMLIKAMKGVDWADLDKDSRNALTRLLEAATEAAKTQAQARQYEAQTERVLLDVRARLMNASDKKRSKAEVQAELAAAMDEIDEKFLGKRRVSV